MPSYSHYVTDKAWLERYNAYQSKYAHDIPERDKALLRLIGEIAKPGMSVLDVGCSTGNFLLHLKRMYPQLGLSGCDLAESSIKVAANTPELSDASFSVMDMLNLKGSYDIVIANAVAVYFTWDEYDKAIQSVARVLKPGGAYIAFEWLHPYDDQDIVIIEHTPGHPEGLRICFRPQIMVQDVLNRHGFNKVEFHPFEIPIDLKHSGFSGDPITHTVKDESGKRIQFRGALAQPWCHLVAQR